MGGNENAQGAVQSADCILNLPSSPSTPAALFQIIGTSSFEYCVTASRAPPPS